MKENKKSNEITARKRTFRNKMESQLNRVKKKRRKFLCPNCNSVSISITFNELLAKVKCITCSLSGEIKTIKGYKPIDVYGEILDIYYRDEEIQRLEKSIEDLKRLEKWGDLTRTYSILSDLYSAKGTCLLKDDNNPSPNEISEWNLKSEKYKRLEKETRLKRDSIANDESSKESKVTLKKDKKIEEIFDDPGFLEF